MKSKSDRVRTQSRKNITAKRVSFHPTSGSRVQSLKLIYLSKRSTPHPTPKAYIYERTSNSDPIPTLPKVMDTSCGKYNSLLLMIESKLHSTIPVTILQYSNRILFSQGIGIIGCHRKAITSVSVKHFSCDKSIIPSVSSCVRFRRQFFKGRSELSRFVLESKTRNSDSVRERDWIRNRDRGLARNHGKTTTEGLETGSDVIDGSLQEAGGEDEDSRIASETRRNGSDVINGSLQEAVDEERGTTHC